MQNRNRLKERIKITGHAFADVTRESNGAIPYHRLSGYLNGVWNLNTEQEKRLLDLIKQWEEKKPPQKSGGNKNA